MTKKWVIVLGVTLAVGLVALLVASAVLAQGPTPPSSSATPQAKWGLRGHSGAFGAPGGVMVGAPGGMDEIAKLLNMTTEEIWAQRVLGKTIADLAKEKGVSNQQLIDALVASQKTMLNQMVTNGRLTQAQADKWLDWYKQAAALQLTEPYVGFGGMRGGPGGMRGPGGMHEFGGMRGRGHWDSSDPQSPTPTP
jgi:lambda repressor-like predicted transcriptional regulator